MANNNLPPTPSTSLPYFVPRIVMVATYSQNTQTATTSTVNNFMQTDMSTYNTSATQTRPFPRIVNQLKLFHNKILKLFKQTLDLMKILLFTLPKVRLLLTYLMKLCQLITLIQTGREKVIKITLPINSSHTKQRKQVTFTQDQQNSSELLDKTVPMSETSPILEKL